VAHMLDEAERRRLKRQLQDQLRALEEDDG
jgi:hypothetical protein